MKTKLKLAAVLTMGSAWAASPGESPLPTMETIVARTFTRAQKEPRNDEAFKATYEFTHRKTTDFKNGRGKFLERRVKVATNEPSAPVPEDICTATATSDWTNVNAISSETSIHKRDLLSDPNLLNRFSFELQGQEVINGRKAFIVDFEPVSRDLPALTLRDRFLNRATGRIWVDEEEYVLVKVEAHLTEGVGLVGGLVGSVHKLNFNFGRERTEDGLWFTSQATWHLEIREVIVERVIDCTETRKNVRRAR